jgi:hypothetical protein
MAHGPRPFENAQIAHSCGKGHLGCINPRHLRWATPKENSADKLLHGTNIHGEDHYHAMLSESDIVTIRHMATRVLQRDIAREFNICESTISKIIHRKSWKHI